MARNRTGRTRGASGRVKSTEVFLRGVWPLGQNQVYQVWKSAMCLRLPRDASGGVYNEVRYLTVFMGTFFFFFFFSFFKDFRKTLRELTSWDQ